MRTKVDCLLTFEEVSMLYDGLNLLLLRLHTAQSGKWSATRAAQIQATESLQERVLSWMKEILNESETMA